MKLPRFRATIISTVLIAILIFVGVSYAWNTATDILQPANPNGAGKTISFTISKDETTAQIANDLQNKGLIRNALAFRVWARIKGLDKNLQAGVYKKLNSDMTISQITDSLLSAQPDASRVLIKEGYRLEQIANALATANPPLTKFNKDDFLKYARDVTQFPDANNEPILKVLPADQKSMEGLLFPNTYDFPVESTATTAIDLLLKTANDTITQNKLDQAAQNYKLSTYQMIILASLVEREARGNADRANIASVYWNRIYTDHGQQEGRGYLQADPTVQYARDTQAQPAKYWLGLNGDPTNISADSKWNTYTNQGFPPTPICSPGLASMAAAASPPKNTYVYFFAGKDGQTHFASTLAEFNQLKATYQVDQ